MMLAVACSSCATTPTQASPLSHTPSTPKALTHS